MGLIAIGWECREEGANASTPGGGEVRAVSGLWECEALALLMEVEVGVREVNRSESDDLLLAGQAVEVEVEVDGPLVLVPVLVKL
jgi:hypothetical protein